jgi:hypothetical protein
VTLNFPKSLPTGKWLVGQSLPASVDLRGSSLPKPGFQVGPSCVGWATTFAMKTYQEAQCELAVSERVTQHPGTIIAKGSNAWVHLVPMTQALANEMSPSASSFLTHTSA